MAWTGIPRSDAAAVADGVDCSDYNCCSGDVVVDAGCSDDVEATILPLLETMTAGWAAGIAAVEEGIVRDKPVVDSSRAVVVVDRDNHVGPAVADPRYGSACRRRMR